MNRGEKWSSNKKLLVFMFIDEKISKNEKIRPACRDAIKKFELNISETALRLRYRVYARNNGKERSNMLFSLKQEQAIRGFIDAWCLLNRPISRTMLLKYVRSLRKGVRGWNPRFWFDRFMARNSSELSLRAVQELSSERQNTRIVNDVHAFVKFMDEWVLKNEILKKIMINCDETRLFIKQGKHGIKKLISKCKTIPGDTIGKRTKCCTYLPFHSADGIICNFFILPVDRKGKTNFQIKKVNTSTRLSVPTYYIFSKSGWLNSEAFFQILKIFISEFQIRHEKKKCAIFMDRLNIHMSDDSVNLCINSNIECIYLPKGTSHFLQPSDLSFFSTFKKLVTRNVIEKAVIGRANNMDIGRQLLESAEDVIKCISPETLKNSWKESGLFPYNRELIIKNLNANFGHVKIDEENTITTNTRTMVMDVLCDALQLNRSVDVNVEVPTETIFTGRDLAILRQNTKKRPRSKQVKHINDEDDEEIFNKNVSNEDVIDNNYNHESLKCFCFNHNAIEFNGDDESASCQWCNSFRYCSNCFCNFTEEFLMHENNCEKNARKKKRIASKISHS